jgi:hypothetical protein
LDGRHGLSIGLSAFFDTDWNAIWEEIDVG